ncbi:hypothetical protein [Olivibacter sitiensis]|nr:hypothetical protein [Olivibacter sitiensis]
MNRIDTAVQNRKSAQRVALCAILKQPVHSILVNYSCGEVPMKALLI